MEIPAHAEALREGGEDFLTEAFRAAGALAPTERVTRITRFAESPGGSTGRKLSLSVEYAGAAPGLHRDLFVKFSRDFDDAIRDRGRDQLEAEVRFALLSRTPGFPIRVPRCYFADYEAGSGTGILITEQIAFGAGGIEPHQDKCLDYRLEQPLDHYRALVTSLARLAGAHRAGRLPDYVEEAFPFDLEKALAEDRIRYSALQLQTRVARYAEFSAAYPQLFPPALRAPAFIARFAAALPYVLDQAPMIKRRICADLEMRALCHWNANIDNAWFWRGEDRRLECGLMDWGRVGQMSVAQALAGALMAAGLDIWNEHLDELLSLFAAELADAGGPVIAVERLKLHLCLSVATSGLAWLMDAPAMIKASLPELAGAASPRGAQFETNETARTQLHMFTVFLNLWASQDIGAMVERLARM